MRFKQRYRYVKSWVDHTGKVRARFMRKGYTSVMLHGGLGSEQFEAEYNAALHGTAAALVPAVGRSKAGSVDRVVAQYLDSGSFNDDLSPLSQQQRRPILARFRKDHGDKLLAAIGAESFRTTAAAFPSAHVARHWIKTMRHLMQYAVDNGFCKTNPTDGIKRKAPPSEGHRLWPDEHIERFRAHYPLGTMQRLALELLLGTGQRISDVQRMGRQHFRGGKLRIKQKKNGVKGVLVDGVEILPELAAALAAMPPSNSLTLLLNANGVPFPEDHGSTWFSRAARAAGVPAGYTAHGLRRACGTRIAENGGTAHEVMAVLGHKSLTESERYTREFDRARAAGNAMAKLRAAGQAEQSANSRRSNA